MKNMKNKFFVLLKEHSELLIIVLALLIIFCTIFLFSALNKHHKEQQYNLAIEQLNKKQWGTAKTMLDNIINYKDASTLAKKADYYYNIDLGDVYLKSQNYDDAIQMYNKAKDIGFNNKEVETKINQVRNEIKLKKQKKENRIKQLKSYFRFKYDKIENYTWIQDKTTPVSETNKIFLYMGQATSNWLRFKIVYSGDDWIFFDEIVFNIDGEKIRKTFNYYDTERRTVYGGGVYEYVDLAYLENKDLINKIINSKNANYRLQGKYYVDRTISATQKNAMKRILEYYNLLENK